MSSTHRRAWTRGRSHICARTRIIAIEPSSFVGVVVVGVIVVVVVVAQWTGQSLGESADSLCSCSACVRTSARAHRERSAETDTKKSGTSVFMTDRRRRSRRCWANRRQTVRIDCPYNSMRIVQANWCGAPSNSLRSRPSRSYGTIYRRKVADSPKPNCDAIELAIILSKSSQRE